MLAVCVNFEIDMASLDAFLTIMEKHASDSLANEVGCHQFDIAQDPQNPTKIFVYELYYHAVAFELHKKACHYLEFNDAISAMVDKKSIRLLQKTNTNLELSIRRFVLSPLKMFTVSDRLALAKT